MIQIRTGQADEETSTLERPAAALSERREEALSAIHAALRFMDSNGGIHTRDEEKSIFPRIDSTALIQELEAEHRKAEGIDAELRAAVGRFESGDEASINDCKTFVSAPCRIYRRHIVREDTQFVPAARAEVSREMKKSRGLV